MCIYFVYSFSSNLAELAHCYEQLKQEETQLSGENIISPISLYPVSTDTVIM